MLREMTDLQFQVMQIGFYLLLAGIVMMAAGIMLSDWRSRG